MQRVLCLCTSMQLTVVKEEDINLVENEENVEKVNSNKSQLEESSNV